jgi:hypothetical protein
VFHGRNAAKWEDGTVCDTRDGIDELAYISRDHEVFLAEAVRC